MTYDYFLQRIYQECLGSIEDTAWPTAILARAGKAYERIFTLNLKHGYVQPTQYDHQAVYYMAEWIQRNVQNGWVQSLALKDLAARITDQILDYYRRNDLPASILFLAAQPVDTPALRLDQEAREIVNTLRQAGDRRFTVHQWHAVRPEDVTAALLEVRPEIVHISGHGTPDGSIWLQDRLGNVKPASASALSALFQWGGTIGDGSVPARVPADGAAGTGRVPRSRALPRRPVLPVGPRAVRRRGVGRLQ
jgi:hypothetical protein